MAPDGTTNQCKWSKMIYQYEYEIWIQWTLTKEEIIEIWTGNFVNIFSMNTSTRWQYTKNMGIISSRDLIVIRFTRKIDHYTSRCECRCNIIPKSARHEFDRRFCSQQIHHKDTVHWSLWIHLKWFVISCWYRLCMKYRGDLRRSICIFQEQIDHIGQCANSVLNQQNDRGEQMHTFYCWLWMQNVCAIP